MLAEGNPLLSHRCRLRVTREKMIEKMRHVHEWSGGWGVRLHATELQSDQRTQSELEPIGSEKGTVATSDRNSNQEAAYEYKRQKE